MYVKLRTNLTVAVIINLRYLLKNAVIILRITTMAVARYALAVLRSTYNNK
jgi:hypothetical protein